MEQLTKENKEGPRSVPHDQHHDGSIPPASPDRDGKFDQCQNEQEDMKYGCDAAIWI
jgi:hypothetical protein